MQQDYDAWKEVLWNDLMTQESKVKKVTVTTDSLPEYLTPIAGKDIPTRFLLDKLTKDFFSMLEMYLIVFRRLLMFLYSAIKPRNLIA